MDCNAPHRASDRPGMLSRRRFIAVAAGCAAAGLMGTNAPVAHDGDAALQRVRRGDIAETPFARVGGTTNGGIILGWTHDAIRLLQSGTPALHTGRMHGPYDALADLYTIEARAQPLSFLVVRRGRLLTDVAAGPQFAPPPPKAANLLASAAQRLQTWMFPGANGVPWSGAVTSALAIAACAAWPDYDTNTGFGSGGWVNGPLYFALKTSPAAWNRLGAARQTQVLDALASTAARVSGLARPDSHSADVPLTVGIQPCDPEPSNGRIVMSLVAGSYLAERTVAEHPWYLDSVDA